MSRVLAIELRRSAALGSALGLLVVGVLLLFFAEGIDFATGWMQLAMTQRLYLALLWPLTLAAGAWQGRRDHRSNVGELFASTPRPRGQRTAPTIAAMALAVVCGYLAMGIGGGLWIIGTARYLPVAVFVVTAVGVLALIAAAWLGLAIGRLLPWLVTAPALGVAGLGLLLLLPAATRPRGWLALVFSPIYEMNLPDAYATVPGRVSGSQAIWLAALAVTAAMLFAAGGWRLRVAALLPVVVGAALAVAVMPHQNRIVTDALDPVAMELVCTEDGARVCVSRVHSGLLSEVSPGAREGLAILAKLPDAPTAVHEDTSSYLQKVYPPWRDDVVLIDVEADRDAHLLDKAKVPVRVVEAAFKSAPTCDSPAGSAEIMAAAGFLMGREPVADAASDPAFEPAREVVDKAGELWRNLGKLPAAEATARVVALRQAALTCSVAEDALSRGTR